MALPAAFLDELRVRTPLAAVIGRRVRLTRSGRQWKGCCPFHGEKTPSFYVYDDHYHCFGCGAHGDAIAFVMQSQGAGFTEAVAQLAAEAGLEVPTASPEAAEAEQRRHDLSSVLAAAAAWYQRRLQLPEGRAALAYLQSRGLSEDTIRRFGLGWSGDGRGALTAELGRDGIGVGLLEAAGLLRAGEDGRAARELFFNRVMFPIRDRGGRMISFGGRTLGDGQPKYVNGPETAAFSKRRTLFALDLAREAVRGGGTLVVVEGYMDVIALHQAGFAGAVAPLGTALTEEQCEALWRLSPQPVLCFDGDAAGARATERALLLSLPMVTIERTVRSIRLPDGEDPDEFVRRRGAPAFGALLATPQGLEESVYAAIRHGSFVQSAEQRAQFVARLEQAIRLVPDSTLRWEYLAAVRRRVRQEFRQVVPRPDRSGLPRPADKLSEARDAERQRILAAILLRHPGLLDDVRHALPALPWPPAFRRLIEALQNWADRTDVLDSDSLIAHLTASGFQPEVDLALAQAPVPLPACAGAAAMPAEAEAGWWHIFGFLNTERLRDEVGQARAAFTQAPTPPAERRLVALTEALNKVLSGEPDGVDIAA